MARGRFLSHGRRWVFPATLLALFSTVRAERLPVRVFTTADGLAGDSVYKIVQDRDGFLWLATSDGLSRFDGRTFENFAQDLGTDRGRVSDVLAARDGTIWITTPEALYRLDASRSVRFEEVPFEGTQPGEWTADLYEDREGRIWWPTYAGLFRVEKGPTGLLLAQPSGIPSLKRTESLLEDGDGSFWIGTGDGLYHVTPDGASLRLTSDDGLPENGVRSISEDREGRIWVGTANGVCVVTHAAGALSPNGLRCVVPPDLRSLVGWIDSVREDRYGTLWFVSSKQGLVALPRGEHAPRFFSGRSRLPNAPVTGIGEDRGGNLWVGTTGSGVLRIVADGLVSFGLDDGLEATRISWMRETRSGELLVGSPDMVVHRLVDRRFERVRPRLPRDIREYGWGGSQFFLEDHLGEWWIPTGQGLLRFARVRHVEELERTLPARIYTKADGLCGNSIFRLFEDSRGDIWTAVIDGDAPCSATVWERATGRFRRMDPRSGFPLRAPTAFIEDRRGDIWIGFYEGELVRYRSGRVLPAPSLEGAIGGNVYALHLDRRGRLWIATQRGGVYRLDHPDADRPSYIRYGTAEGLSSSEVVCITEDAFGRLYFGTRRGLDRLEVDTGRVRHFTQADGLPNSRVEICYEDHVGDLWFGTRDGLAKLTPRPEPSAPPPPVFIDRMIIGGVPEPLPGLVASIVPEVVLPASRDSIEVSFLGLEFDAGSFLRYQWRLRDEQDSWSEPTEQQAVLLASLPPGRHKFEVRAVNSDGVPSATPATVSFRVLPPFWRRGWFLAVVGLACLAATVTGYRLRVAHLIAMYRQSTRISLDLHDELGSGLGSIGLLADLGADEGVDEARRRGVLRQIGDAAAEAGTALADIVGTLRPGAESLRSLAEELSERGRRLFPGSGPVFSVLLPEPMPEVLLSLPVRRNVFLIALEALHNASQHAEATRVFVELAPAGRRFRLVVGDDGRGMDLSTSGHEPSRSAGLGLESMRRRADQIGADLSIESRPGEGTEVTVEFDPGASDRRVRVGRARAGRGSKVI